MLANDQYEIWRIRPQTAFDLLVRVMERFPQHVLDTPQMFADANMETAGVASWTASSGATLTKVTTAANVHMGTQALRIQADSTDDYAESASIKVIPGQTYYVSTIARADVGTVLLVVYDKTNSAEIESSSRVSHSLEKYMQLWRTFTVPSTCEEISVRLQLSGATDDGYFDRVSGPYLMGRGVIPAPSWMATGSNLGKLLTAKYERTYANGVNDAESRVFSAPWQRGPEYTTRLIHQDANQYRIELSRPIPQAEIWLEATRPAADFTTFVFTAAGETSPTTSIPKDLLALRWLEEICEHVLDFEEPSLHDEAAETLTKIRSGISANSLAQKMREYTADLVTPSVRRRTVGNWTGI